MRRDSDKLPGGDLHGWVYLCLVCGGHLFFKRFGGLLHDVPKRHLLGHCWVGCLHEMRN